MCSELAGRSPVKAATRADLVSLMDRREHHLS